MEWISVEVAVPKDNGHVYVLTGDTRSGELLYDMGGYISQQGTNGQH